MPRVPHRAALVLQQPRNGYKRLDVFLSAKGYARLLELMEYGEGRGTTIERVLMDYSP